MKTSVCKIDVLTKNGQRNIHRRHNSTSKDAICEMDDNKSIIATTAVSVKIRLLSVHNKKVITPMLLIGEKIVWDVNCLLVTPTF